ncbi:MAG: LPS-assembly protein LptD [Janthinobacterium lividum]
MPPRLPIRSNPPANPPSRRKRVVIALFAAGCVSPVTGFAQLTGDAARPVALDPKWGFSLAPQIVESTLTPGQTPGTFSLGDHVSADGERQTTLTGHAELRRYGAIIRADKIHYDADTDVADAYGSVRINQHGNLFSGPRASMALEARVGYMLTPTYHFGESGAGGKGERLDMLDDERTRIIHGTYSACNCEDPSWYVRASRFDMDQGDNSGTARNGVLFFQGVPIFASPYLTFPLSNDRQSGILPPTFSINSSSGVDITVPYYVNIAPNRDLTLRPRILERRGAMLSADFRYLSPTYFGTDTIEFMPLDAVAKRVDRYAIFLKHNQNFGDGFSGYVNYNRVSDAAYTSDLSSGNTIIYNGTQLLFSQEAGLRYDHGPWSVLVREQRWQSLDNAVPPYAREPELDVNYQKYDVGGFDFGAEGNYTRFTSPSSTLPTGQRLFLNPYVSYPIVRPGWFVIPKVQYHLASYDLNYIPSTIDSTQPQSLPNKNINVAIPTVSLDSGLKFERSVHVLGRDYIQTLEPRLFYVYTPYRNQSDIPVFDTAQSDFGLAEIFSTNTFVGNDRIADGSRLTAALSTRFLNPENGDERARFLIAQQYNFRMQQTTMPNLTASDASHTDLILGASFKLSDTFATQNAFQYNQDSNRIDRLNTGFAWSPEDRKVINLAYRYTRVTSTLAQNSGEIKQAVLSAQWPVMRNVYAVGRVNYAFDSHRLVDGLVGFQYDAPCWTLGVALQRYANGLTTSGNAATGTRFLAQLTLKGFSNIDNGLVASFRASVPGYVPPPAPADPVSRFSDYD